MVQPLPGSHRALLDGRIARAYLYAPAYTIQGGTSTILRNIIATQEKKVTIELIQKRVGEQFGLRDQDLKLRSNAPR